MLSIFTCFIAALVAVSRILSRILLFAKYHIWNNKSEGVPNMVLSTETFNQSVRTEYSEAVNARYTFQPLGFLIQINK